MCSIFYINHTSQSFKVQFEMIILLLNQETLIIAFSVSKDFCTINVSGQINDTSYETIIEFLMRFFLVLGFAFLKIPKFFEFICEIPSLRPIT